jgi:hypothetical protein
MKDQSDRIRELEGHCEALANAIEEIRAATRQRPGGGAGSKAQVPSQVFIAYPQIVSSLDLGCRQHFWG